jgi:hypothetical protein
VPKFRFKTPSCCRCYTTAADAADGVADDGVAAAVAVSPRKTLTILARFKAAAPSPPPPVSERVLLLLLFLGWVLSITTSWEAKRGNKWNGCSMFAQLPPYNDIPAVEVLAPLSPSLPPSLQPLSSACSSSQGIQHRLISAMWAEEEEYHQEDIATRPMENISSPSLPPAPCSCSSLVSLFFFFVFCLVGVCRGASSSTIPAQERPTTPKQHNPTTKSLQQQKPKICFSQKTTENLQPNLFQEKSHTHTETNTQPKISFRKHSKHTTTTKKIS